MYEPVFMILLLHFIGSNYDIHPSDRQSVRNEAKQVSHEI